MKYTSVFQILESKTTMFVINGEMGIVVLFGENQRGFDIL